MSAWLIVVDVCKNVITLLDPITVPVGMVISWPMTVTPVMVSTQRELIARYYMFDMLNFLIDINECDFSNGGCEHNCVNTDGSYYYSCHHGYLLQNDTFNCTGTYV